MRLSDYNDPDSFKDAFKGVDRLIFISGIDIAVWDKQHENVVIAAKTANVRHIAYTSSARKTETKENPLGIVATRHLKTERLIKNSGMDYTVLRNNLYMDIIPMFLGENVSENGL